MLCLVLISVLALLGTSHASETLALPSVNSVDEEKTQEPPPATTGTIAIVNKEVDANVVCGHDGICKHRQKKELKVLLVGRTNYPYHDKTAVFNAFGGEADPHFPSTKVEHSGQIHSQRIQNGNAFFQMTNTPGLKADNAETVQENCESIYKELLRFDDQVRFNAGVIVHRHWQSGVPSNDELACYKFIFANVHLPLFVTIAGSSLSSELQEEAVRDVYKIYNVTGLQISHVMHLDLSPIVQHNFIPDKSVEEKNLQKIKFLEKVFELGSKQEHSLSGGAR